MWSETQEESYFSGYFEISVSIPTAKQTRWKQMKTKGLLLCFCKKCFLLNRMIQSCTQFKLDTLGGNSYPKALGRGKMEVVSLSPMSIIASFPRIHVNKQKNKKIHSRDLSGIL